MDKVISADSDIDRTGHGLTFHTGHCLLNGGAGHKEPGAFPKIPGVSGVLDKAIVVAAYATAAAAAFHRGEPAADTAVVAAAVADAAIVVTAATIVAAADSTPVPGGSNSSGHPLVQGRCIVKAGDGAAGARAAEYTAQTVSVVRALLGGKGPEGRVV